MSNRPFRKGRHVMLFAEQFDGLILFFFVLAIVVLAAIMLACGAKAREKRDKGLEKLAQRLGGSLQPTNLISYPVLLVPHMGRTVRLYYTSGEEDEIPRTHLMIPWPNDRLRCEIFLEGPRSPLRKLIGMQDIEIGSPHFDRQFIITGNDEAAIKAFLTPDAQARVLDLLSLRSLSYLRIADGRLSVMKDSYLTDVAAIEQFIRLFQQFYNAATAVPRAGIEFLEAAPVPSAKASGEALPHCIVCGEALAHDLITCRSCRTPHHRDCWHYFGGCATFACGGKQFVQR